MMVFRIVNFINFYCTIKLKSRMFSCGLDKLLNFSDCLIESTFVFCVLDPLHFSYTEYNIHGYRRCLIQCPFREALSHGKSPNHFPTLFWIPHNRHLPGQTVGS